MGKLKQLLPYGTGTLVQHAVDQARRAGFAPLVVVVGAETEQMRARLAALPIEIAENKKWRMGMGSSIACGMEALKSVAPQSAAVLMMLADQPLVTAEHLREMRALLSPDCVAVAAEYSGSLGVPAIFQRKTFPALLTLSPNAGAKHVLQKLGDSVRRFPLPEASADIDTPEDYARLSS
jgi:molybdenum cofactor cytidylyltransferase